MRFGWRLGLQPLLILCLAAGVLSEFRAEARGETRIEDFYGRYAGSGIATDHDEAAATSPRQLALVMRGVWKARW